MRDLTLLETGLVAGGLVLCLLLPLLISLRGPMDGAIRKSCMRIVWTGQAILAGAGVLVLASSSLAPFAAGLGLLIYLSCAVLLLRRLHGVHSACEPV